MRNLLFLILAFLCVGSALGQNKTYEDPIYDNPQKTEKDIVSSKSDNNLEESTEAPKDNGVLYIQVPQKLKINDNIFIVNHTNYTLERVVLAVMNNDSPEVIASASNILPGIKHELASYSDNGLKQLRGKTIAIKMKGIKGKEEPYEITYAFKVTLSEDRHDLYITVSNGDRTFDF